MAKNSLGREIPANLAGALAGPVPGSLEPQAGGASGHPPPGASPPRREQAAALAAGRHREVRTEERHEHLHPPRPAQRRRAAEPAGQGTGRHGAARHGHRLQLGARRACRDHPLHPQGRDHPDRDRGQRPDRRTGQQGRTGLPHRGAQPWRAGPLPGHRGSGGRCRLHRRPMLRHHRQPERGSRAVGLRLPGLRPHRRPLRQEGRRRHRQPGAVSLPLPSALPRAKWITWCRSNPWAIRTRSSPPPPASPATRRRC